VGLQKISHALVRVNLIFYSRESVALIFVDFVVRRAAALLDLINNLNSFFFGAARIMPSGE
jgi:hypothetical protein